MKSGAESSVSGQQKSSFSVTPVGAGSSKGKKPWWVSIYQCALQYFPSLHPPFSPNSMFCPCFMFSSSIPSCPRFMFQGQAGLGRVPGPICSFAHLGNWQITNPGASRLKACRCIPAAGRGLQAKCWLREPEDEQKQLEEGRASALSAPLA